MDYEELTLIKERILADEPRLKLYRAETNVRLAKALGLWSADQDDDGVRVTLNLEGGGKRTLFLEKCTPATMYDRHVVTLALTVRDYCGSIDETRNLIVEHCKYACSISISEDPSGTGAKFIWWPNGLGGDERTIQTHCQHQEMQLALLWCFVEALIKNSWFMKSPELHKDKETEHA